jgi:hypothetical protein
MNPSSGRLAIAMLAILYGCAGISPAQSLIPNMGHPSTPFDQSPPKQAAPKNLLPLAELNALDLKFHQELDAAQDAFDRESFSDAERGLAQLTGEIEDTIKKIAVSTLPKNGFLEVDGVKKPATAETETEWFTRILDKARNRKDAAGILRNVAGHPEGGNGAADCGKVSGRPGCVPKIGAGFD